jgi:hypothetical protein
MTIRDIEVIEALADQPELLAIADAVSATHPRTARPRAGRRRSAVRVALAAAVVAAAIVAVLAAPQGRSGVVGKALAAIGDGPIMHLVTEFKPGTVYVNLKTGHRTTQVWREEFWADRNLGHFHLVLSTNGRVIGDVLYPKDAKNGAVPLTPNPAFIALWTGYRSALQDGSVTLVGRGTVGGRPVYWLRFKASEPLMREEVAVDATTYKPVLYRFYANGKHFDQRILVADAIAYHASDFRRRGPSLVSGGGGSSSSGGSVSPPGAPSAPVAVRAPWLTAGPRVVGLRLRSANPLSESENFGGKHTSLQGIELVYGPIIRGGAAPPSTTIDELPRPDLPQPWHSIPAGSIEIQPGSESSSGSGTQPLWTGYLVKDGRYITINTPAGERALLAIARALHRGRK